jgi:predicted nucleic-acid-binding Zn-ribbon protein
MGWCGNLYVATPHGLHGLFRRPLLCPETRLKGRETVSEERQVDQSKICSHCGGKELYSQRLSSAGAQGPYFLAGLGSFMHYAQFDVVICASCGLTQFFAEPEARGKLKSGGVGWRRVL